MKEYTYSNYFFIKLILKYKFHFGIITIVAVLLAALFSSQYFIKPKYKSTATVYPSNLLSYSDESPSEQMLQLMQASEVRDGVINKFDLATHYDIDTSQISSKSALIAEYESNIDIKRTQYESIEIQVMDTDPVTAKDMVLGIIAGFNLKARSLQREKTKEILAMHENHLKLKKQQVDSLGSKLQELMEKYKLLDYSIQTKEATKSYLKGGAKASEAHAILESLEKKGGLFYELWRSYDVTINSYNSTKLEYDAAYKDIQKELTYTNMVVEPAIADKKSYPVRWLIVAASVASANIFLFFVFLFFEKRKEII